MEHGRSRYVTHEQLEEVVEELHERMERMATQADVDAITTQVQQVASDLDAAKNTLQAEIDSLAQGNPTLDLSGLQSAVAQALLALQGGVYLLELQESGDVRGPSRRSA